jgi:hypothetical protein
LFPQGKEVPVLMHSPEVWERTPREWGSSTGAFSWGRGTPRMWNKFAQVMKTRSRKTLILTSYCGWCWCWLAYDFNAEEPLARNER